MIKINLAARKKSQVSASSATRPGGLGQLDLASLRGQLEGLKEIPWRRFALPVVVGIVATYSLDSYKESELKGIEEELTQIQAERPKLEAEAAKIKNYEQLKTSMEKDEFIIRTKLETIRTLIAGRGAGLKLLEDVAKMTPPQLWLTDFNVKDGVVTFKGLSTDFSNISEFMRTLNENPLLKEMNLKDAQTTKDEAKRELATFEVNAKKK